IWNAHHAPQRPADGNGQQHDCQMTVPAFLLGSIVCIEDAEVHRCGILSKDTPFNPARKIKQGENSIFDREGALFTYERISFQFVVVKVVAKR
ncbi:MAG: hypothetical protein K6E37_02405, partial [Bacteroidales bacterium]|nr:hypothetical protein [Bacteroidales bacterium]